MCNEKTAFNLSSDLFERFNLDCNKIINRSIGKAKMRGAEEVIITAKLTIKLEGNDSITVPTVKHDISAVMTVKDKVSGESDKEGSLAYDKDSDTWMWVPGDTQMSVFDSDEPIGNFSDVEYRELPSHEEEEDVEEDEETYKEDDESKIEARDESTPFGWLSQFVGEEMIVVEGMENYTVRTKSGKIILSSATTPNHPFYCDAEILKDHVGHELICAGYGEDSITKISIECYECHETLFTMEAPETASDDEEDEGEPEEKGYGYDEPED